MAWLRLSSIVCSVIAVDVNLIVVVFYIVISVSFVVVMGKMLMVFFRIGEGDPILA